jgi:hypothetical protein
VIVCVQLVSGNVIGLDFGSDSMKVAIVQPGTPLEIGLWHAFFLWF